MLESPLRMLPIEQLSFSRGCGETRRLQVVHTVPRLTTSLLHGYPSSSLVGLQTLNREAGTPTYRRISRYHDLPSSYYPEVSTSDFHSLFYSRQIESGAMSVVFDGESLRRSRSFQSVVLRTMGPQRLPLHLAGHLTKILSQPAPPHTLSI